MSTEQEKDFAKWQGTPLLRTVLENFEDMIQAAYFAGYEEGREKGFGDGFDAGEAFVKSDI